jgi:hypothetical protein
VRNYATIAVFGASVLTLIACGKLNENFGRLHKDYTVVNFGDERSRLDRTYMPQNGGVMVYIMNTAAGGQGMIVGFTNDTAANNAQVAIPNGTYKIYGLGWEGTSVTGGQARCGYGSNGTPVTLSGGSVNIPIDLTTANCNFGSDSDFSYAADYYAGNFANTTVDLCAGNPYPTCTATSTSSIGLRVTQLAGVGGSGQLPTLNPAGFLVSACTATSSNGVFTFGSNLTIPVSSTFAMPVRFDFYGDASCTTSVIRSYQFMDGLKGSLATSSTSTSYVYTTSTIQHIDFYKDF